MKAPTRHPLFPLHERPTDDVEAAIQERQDTQRQNPPTSRAWRKASAELAPLFAEMARRTA